MARFNRWTYTVSGSGVFPLDMLRYDACWPSGQDDVGRVLDSLDSIRPIGSQVANLGESERAERALKRREALTAVRYIEVTGTATPTVARWASFGWTVHLTYAPTLASGRYVPPMRGFHV